jgi:hypothetical protein
VHVLFRFIVRPSGASTDPIVYTFSPVSFNSMELIPPTTMASEPRYHISVRVNCFSPSFWVTAIRRGDSENGEYVGDFEYVLACIQEFKDLGYMIISSEWDAQTRNQTQLAFVEGGTS